VVNGWMTTSVSPSFHVRIHCMRSQETDVISVVFDLIRQSPDVDGDQPPKC